jgi:pentafunctional AROM polypeptide
MTAASQQPGWSCVQGIDVLIEQGLWQFKYWTGCKAPQHMMLTRVQQAYSENE